MEETNQKNVKLVRLTDGTDLIVNLISEEDHYVTFSETLVLYVEPNLDTLTQMMYLYPWLSQGVANNLKSELKILRSHVFFISEVTPEIIESYRKMWESLEEGEDKDPTDSGDKKIVSFKRSKKNPTNVH